MTKFKNYINEVGIIGVTPENIDEAVEIINKNCKKFVKEIQGYGFPYRGFASMDHAKQVIPHSSVLYEHQVRKDRQPRYIPKDLHKFLSEYSKKNFGWDIRTEGVFTASRNTAKNYSAFREPPKAVIPIGNYKYVCLSKNLIKLYGLYDAYTRGDAYIENDDWVKRELIGHLKNYRTNGIQNVVQNQGASWECIINTDKYYSIPNMFSDEILSKLY